METTVKKLNELGAMPPVLEWANQCAKKGKTLKEAWDTCDDGQVLLWILGRLTGAPFSKARKELALAISKCVRLVLVSPNPDTRNPRAILGVFATGIKHSDEILDTALHNAIVYYQEVLGRKYNECPPPEERQAFINEAINQASYAIVDTFDTIQTPIPSRAGIAALGEAARSLACLVSSHLGIKKGGRAAMRFLAKSARILRRHYPNPPPELAGQ
jgi:hypothetical protein